MKNKIYLLLALLLFLGTSAIGETLTINISGIEQDRGLIHVGVFSESKEFPDGMQTEGVTVNSDEEVTIVTLEVRPASYAIAIFQDSNANNVLDKNLLGIPKEKYGFSGKNVFGQPSFEDAMIVVNGDQTILIEIK